MPKAALLGDMGSDHHGYPATPIISGTSTVLIDGKPVARIGDSLMEHDKPLSPKHPRMIASGSTTVLIEGKFAARVGDKVDCGGVIVGGSSVNIG